MSIEAQAALAEEFVRGVVERFGMEAVVSSTIDEDHIRVSVDGDNVGLLIGPRGATIDALQELTRTVVQRRSEDAAGRVNVDVGGYRARRAAALAQFARKIASEVLEGGNAQALEPMNPADRKVVHDAVNEMTGVTTSSEGDEPRRYVVIRPAAELSAPVDREPEEDRVNGRYDEAVEAGSVEAGSDETESGYGDAEHSEAS